jgi:hypothetical protein
LHLEITTWSERVVGLLQNICRVFETGKYGTSMNIVKFVAENPFVFGIFDPKAAIRWMAL